MSKQDVLDRREQRLDQAYWNYIGYMDETRYEGVSEREIEEQYVRLDRIATLLARAADAAFACRYPNGLPEVHDAGLCEHGLSADPCYGPAHFCSPEEIAQGW